jgi:hypothetical protein
MNGLRLMLVSLLVLSVGVTAVQAEEPEPELPPKLVEQHYISFNDASGAYREEYEEGLRDVGLYQSGMTPWMDLLVPFPDGNWYGPERNPSDGIEALPLPEDFWWEVTEAFGVTPNGEVWWMGQGTEGVATLHGPESALALMVTDAISSTAWSGSLPSLEVTAVYSFPFRIEIGAPSPPATPMAPYPTAPPPGPGVELVPWEPVVVVKTPYVKVTPPPAQKP